MLGGGRDLRIVILLEKECRFSCADNVDLDPVWLNKEGNVFTVCLYA